MSHEVMLCCLGGVLLLWPIVNLRLVTSSPSSSGDWASSDLTLLEGHVPWKDFFWINKVDHSWTLNTAACVDVICCWYDKCTQINVPQTSADLQWKCSLLYFCRHLSSHTLCVTSCISRGAHMTERSHGGRATNRSDLHHRTHHHHLLSSWMSRGGVPARPAGDHPHASVQAWTGLHGEKTAVTGVLPGSMNDFGLWPNSLPVFIPRASMFSFLLNK